MVHYLYNVICFQFRIVPVAYFLDEMLDYEVNDILDNLDSVDRPLWEQCRLNTYVLALVNSRKQIKPLDIVTFNWETEEKQIEISTEDIERLKAISETIKVNGNI